MIQNIIVIAVCAYSYFFMKKVLDNTTVDGPLTKNEKINVIITLIVATLPAYFIYYFGWKEKLPIKAKQVNKYVWNIIGWLVAIGIIGILVAILLVAVKR